MSIHNSLLIFDFNKTSNISSWVIVNDIVMGGRSKSNFYINEEGFGVFEGCVSIENNGGFASVRHNFKTIKVETYSKIKIRLRGDGKRYQFRIKSNKNAQYSYINYVETTGDWQLIEIPLAIMYPTFRGRKLNLPNYSGKNLEEVAFLIGNKIAENFKLEIDTIRLQ